jgi:hypothetical protein
MDAMTVLPVLLLVAMLAITATRTAAPIGARVPGQTVLEIPVGFMFRALSQRTNVIAILAVLAIGSGAFGDRWISQGLFLFTIVALLALLLLPSRYRFTTDGVSPDRARFIAWSELAGWRTNGNVIELQGKGRPTRARLYVTGPNREAARKVLTRFLGAPPAH